MQEHGSRVGAELRAARAVFVLATQNRSTGGTIRCRGGQLDRFLSTSSSIIRQGGGGRSPQVTGPQSAAVEKVLDAAQVPADEELVRRVRWRSTSSILARDLCAPPVLPSPKPGFRARDGRLGRRPARGIQPDHGGQDAAAIHGRTPRHHDGCRGRWPIRCCATRAPPPSNAEAAGVRAKRSSAGSGTSASFRNLDV